MLFHASRMELVSRIHADFLFILRHSRRKKMANHADLWGALQMESHVIQITHITAKSMFLLKK